MKVHVHTNDPGMAMQRGLTYGSLTTIIIENMRLERDEKISAMKEKEMQNTANAENEIRAAEENEQEVPAAVSYTHLIHRILPDLFDRRLEDPRKIFHLQCQKNRDILPIFFFQCLDGFYIILQLGHCHADS